MKHNVKFSLASLIVFLSLSLILTNCKKNDSTAVTGMTITTSAATLIGQQWALLNGTVMAGNQTVIVSFEYDTTTTYRYSVAADPDTVTGTTLTLNIAPITGLLKNTTYHFRIKTVTAKETKYGSDLSFTTTNPAKSKVTYNPALVYGTVTDVDNNVYKTIEIGTQTWMAENLKTTKYSDGSSIPYVPKPGSWTQLSTPGYNWYNNDSVVYGALYNWYSVNTGKLCPAGWHVPGDSEWGVMTTSLGDQSLAAITLKETGNTHWTDAGSGSTNATGFTALPGGYCNTAGSFSNIKRYGYWWSSTESSTSDGYCRNIFYSFTTFDKNNSSKKSGLSVRCIKD